MKTVEPWLPFMIGSLKNYGRRGNIYNSMTHRFCHSSILQLRVNSRYRLCSLSCLLPGTMFFSDPVTDIRNVSGRTSCRMLVQELVFKFSLICNLCLCTFQYYTWQQLVESFYQRGSAGQETKGKRNTEHLINQRADCNLGLRKCSAVFMTRWLKTYTFSLSHHRHCNCKFVNRNYLHYHHSYKMQLKTKQ
jgi:hypothetical protein